MHVNGSIYGIMQRDEPEYEYIPIPDQDVSHLYYEYSEEMGWAIREAYYPDDITPFTLEKQAALIDRDTGETINKMIHSFAGVYEELSILRDQIRLLLKEQGMKPTEKFRAIQDIAEAKIAEGQEKKTTL